MSVRTAIYTLMSGLEPDVWPLKAPEGTSEDHGVYFISREKIRSQDGTEFEEVRLRVEVYADNYDNVIALAATFEADLDIKDETVISGETLHVAYMENESDDYIWDEKKFNITQEYTLKFY